MNNFNVGTLASQITLNTVQANRSLWNFGQHLSAFERQIAHVGVSLTFGLSLPIQALIAASSRTFVELEDAAIRTTTRIAGAGKETARQIEGFVTNLSLSIPLAAIEIEESLDQVNRMGGNLKFAEQMTPAFSKFAKVLDVDVREATDVTIRAWNTLGLVGKTAAEDASNLNEMMNKIVLVQESTGWSAKETLEAWQHGAAASRKFGMSIQDLALSFMMLGRAGKEGREAGTSLTMILSSLDRSHSVFRDQWAKIFGSELAKNWETMAPMDKLKEFRNTMQKYTESGRESVYSSLGLERRQTSHLDPFLNQLGALDEFKGKLAAVNTVEDRFIKLMESSKQQLILVWNQFKALGVELGGDVVPMLLSLAKGFLGVVTIVARLTPTWLLLTAAILGPGIVAFTLLKNLVFWLKAPETWAATRFGLAYIARGFIGLKNIMVGNSLVTMWASMSGGIAGVVGWLGKMLAAMKAIKIASFFSIFAGVNAIGNQLGPLAAMVKLMRNFAKATGWGSMTVAMSMGGGPKTWKGFGNALMNLGPAALMNAPLMVSLPIIAGVTAAIVGLGYAFFKLTHITKTVADTERDLAAVRAGLAPGMFAGAKMPQFAAPGTMADVPSGFAGTMGLRWKQAIPFGGFADILSELGVARDELNKQMNDPNLSPKAKIEQLTKAFRNKIIDEDQFNKAQQFLESSGFTASPEGDTGEEDFQKTRGHARGMTYFSAKTKGSVEEYRERIMGQQSLLRAADTSLGVAKRIEKNTEDTARGVKSIEESVGEVPQVAPIGK